MQIQIVVTRFPPVVNANHSPINYCGHSSIRYSVALIFKITEHFKMTVVTHTSGFLTYKLSSFYPRDAMLARVIEIATCLSVRLSVRPSRAGIVSKRRKLAA